MIDVSRLVIREVGCIARRALDGGGSGRVVATFETTFYLSFNGQLVCFGGSNLMSGPLNVIVDASTHFKQIMLHIRHGMPVGLSGSVLQIGPWISADLAAARIWAPAHRSRPPAPTAIRRQLTRLRWMVGGRDDIPAFGQFIDRSVIVSDPHCIAGAASASMIACRCWLQSNLHRLSAESRDKPIHMKVNDRQAAGRMIGLVGLVGLGAGLTPSGDDCLGGMMIALHAVSGSALARDLWARIEPVATTDTSPISMAHLAAAAEGLGCAAVHDLVDALLAGDNRQLQYAFEHLLTVGHSSGWDTLAGIVMVLDVVCQSVTDAQQRTSFATQVVQESR